MSRVGSQRKCFLWTVRTDMKTVSLWKQQPKTKENIILRF